MFVYTKAPFRNFRKGAFVYLAVDYLLYCEELGYLNIYLREPHSFSGISIFLFQKNGGQAMYYNLNESGRRIQHLRKQNNLTQGQLAEKLNISISTMGRIERGEQGLSIDLLIEIGVYFGVQTDYILLGYSIQTESVKQQIRELIPKLQRLEQTM